MKNNKTENNLSSDDTIGHRELCAWKTGAGTVRVQTRLPILARKLGQRRDATLVGYGVQGGYLRIYAFKHGLSWAKRLVDRYTTPNLKATGGPILPLVCAQTRLKPPGGVIQRPIAPARFSLKTRLTGVPADVVLGGAALN